MPVYEYSCPENGESIEVLHEIDRVIVTWRELCDVDGRELGGTDPDAPVERILRGRIFVTGNLEDLSKGKVVRK